VAHRRRLHGNFLSEGAQSAAKDAVARPEDGGAEGGEDSPGEFKAEGERGEDQGGVVLVEAAAVEEIDVVEGGVGDGDEELGWGGGWCGDEGWF